MNEEEDLIDILQAAGLSDEEIEQIMGIGGLYEEQGLLRRERLGARLRAGAEGPLDRRMGDVYRAAHPLEHLASGASRALGGIQSARIGRRQRELIDEATNRRARLMKMLLRSRRLGSGYA